MKMLFLFFLLLISGCSSGGKVQAPRRDPIQLALSSSVAFMQYYDSSNEDDGEDISSISGAGPEVSKTLYRAYCGGVWVKGDLILTANHCATDIAFVQNIQKLPEHERAMAAATGLIVPQPKKTLGVEMEYIVPFEANGLEDKPKAMHKGRVVAVSVEHDLALVKVDGLSAPRHIVAPLARTQPELGEDLLTVGHPAALLFSFERATVAAFRDRMTARFEKKGAIGPFLQVSGFIWKGNSGGGMFNTDGELVSIVLFKHPDSNQSLGSGLVPTQIFLNDNIYKLYR